MNNKKIVCRVFGGIGNQLFIYATARRFAIQYGGDLFIDDISGFNTDKVYNRKFALNNFTTVYSLASKHQRLEPFAMIRRKFARLVSVKISPSLNGYIYNPYVDYRKEFNSLPKNNNIYMEGYWQSYKYFIDVEDQLKKELKIIQPTDKNNIEMAIRMTSRPSTAVHLRFFDNDITPHTEAWINYYRSATQAIRDRHLNSHFFIFSDNLEKAAAFAVSVWGKDFTIVSINDSDRFAFCDMWLMSQCCNIITADSTFSWWGAWFNSSNNKLIIAPRYSLSGRDEGWNIEAMIPKNWSLV